VRQELRFNYFIQENKAGLSARGLTGKFITINTSQNNWGESIQLEVKRGLQMILN